MKESGVVLNVLGEQRIEALYRVLCDSARIETKMVLGSCKIIHYFNGQSTTNMNSNSVFCTLTMDVVNETS